MIPKQSRSFHLVLQRAQAILQKRFGMELHELRTKQKQDEITEATTQAGQGQNQDMSLVETQRAVRGGESATGCRLTLSEGIWQLHSAVYTAC